MLYKEMSPEALKAAYQDTKTLLHNSSQLRRATSVIRLSRQLDIIVAVARKRGIPLT